MQAQIQMQAQQAKQLKKCNAKIQMESQAKMQ